MLEHPVIVSEGKIFEFMFRMLKCRHTDVLEYVKGFDIEGITFATPPDKGVVSEC